MGQFVLSDEKLLVKYTGGKCKVPSGGFERQYCSELAQLVLYRLLVLILFLDQAKQASILEIPLFKTTSGIKSSRELLLALSRDVLHAEGDFAKHLSRLGIRVVSQQRPIEEIDFSVTNLAVDLRDGVRLAKLVEIWTKKPRDTLLTSLRIPAVSRLQKLHNVRLVLSELSGDANGAPNVPPHSIVDGHCQRVLQLLWYLVANHCLDELLPVQILSSEVDRLQRLRPIQWDRRDTGLSSLLLKWVNCISQRFSLIISNWTDSFDDGRAVCLLIHYYHPKLLPLREISEDEAFNSFLANRKMKQLGGIPDMIPLCSKNEPPNERSMILCITCLCSRLIESSYETRAIRIIQDSYRRFRAHQRASTLCEAARIIWRAWNFNKFRYFKTQYSRYHKAVLKIESFALNYKEKLARLKKERVKVTLEYEATVLIQVRGATYGMHTNHAHVLELTVFGSLLNFFSLVSGECCVFGGSPK